MDIPNLFAGDTQSLDFFQTIDIYPIFFDKYLNQEISKYITKKLERINESNFVAAYLENSGSTALEISQLGPTKIIESNGFLRDYLNILEKNLKNIPIHNAGQPFDLLNSNSILVVRGDNMDLGKLISDLYHIGLAIQVVVLGVPMDVDNKKFWDNAPIYGHQSQVVDMKDDTSLQNILETSFRYYKLVYARITKKVSIHSFFIRKTKDKKRNISKELEIKYRPNQVDIEDDPTLEILSRHDFLNSYFPPKGPLPKMALQILGENIVRPFCYDTMNQVVELMKIKIPGLKSKSVHHYDSMSSVTAIPLAYECEALYTYSPLIEYDRIYNVVNKDTELENIILFRQYDVLYRNSLPTSPNILMMNPIDDHSQIKDGDIVFTTHYKSKELVKSLVDLDIPIYIVFLHPETHSLKYKDLTLIGELGIDTKRSFEIIRDQK